MLLVFVFSVGYMCMISAKQQGRANFFQAGLFTSLEDLSGQCGSAFKVKIFFRSASKGLSYKRVDLKNNL